MPGEQRGESKRFQKRSKAVVVEEEEEHLQLLDLKPTSQRAVVRPDRLDEVETAIEGCWKSLEVEKKF